MGPRTRVVFGIVAGSSIALGLLGFVRRHETTRPPRMARVAGAPAAKSSPDLARSGRPIDGRDRPDHGLRPGIAEGMEPGLYRALDDAISAWIKRDLALNERANHFAWLPVNGHAIQGWDGRVEEIAERAGAIRLRIAVWPLHEGGFTRVNDAVRETYEYRFGQFELVAVEIPEGPFVTTFN